MSVCAARIFNICIKLLPFKFLIQGARKKLFPLFITTYYNISISKGRLFETE